MDVRKMDFKTDSFDAVVDKGMLDTILVIALRERSQCGEKSSENAKLMLAEVYRVLSPTGLYLCVSYGAPQAREEYFKNVSADLGVVGNVEVERHMGQGAETRGQSWEHPAEGGTEGVSLHLCAEEGCSDSGSSIRARNRGCAHSVGHSTGCSRTDTADGNHGKDGREQAAGRGEAALEVAKSESENMLSPRVICEDTASFMKLIHGLRIKLRARNLLAPGVNLFITIIIIT